MRSQYWCLLANFGAEEGRSVDLDQPIYHRLARLWSLLFQPPIHWITPEPSTTTSDIFADTSDPLAEVAFCPSAMAWLSTSSAHQSIARLGLLSVNPEPAIVRSCHDKAFVLNEARSRDPLTHCSRLFDPHQLRDADSLVTTLRDTISDWPAWAQVDWTIKPRFGSSGRGRIPGIGLDVDTQLIRRNLPRLIEQGGFILQPFCRERTDLSVQLDIPANPSLPVRLLGSLRPIVTTSGSYQGHLGITHEATASSDHSFDTPLREQAIAWAQIARSLGFFGPCGVDAFVYEHNGQSHLHICEFNARWTVGHVVHGIVRRLTGKLDFLTDGFEFRLDERLDGIDRHSILLTSSSEEAAATIKPWSR
jgi:hypothetical protein